MNVRHACTVTFVGALVSAVNGCGGGGGGGAGTGRDASPPDAGDASVDAAEDAASDAELPDLVMSESDFECVLRWQLVGHYRIANKLGHQAEAVAVANDPNGGQFPVGTVLQIVPNEAMVKRRVGFSPASHDWEFFALSTSASGTTILERGTTGVANGFGTTCISCHALASSQFDLICGETHGCDPLPFSAMQLESFQANDPRCP